jgi:hypothetical protein
MRLRRLFGQTRLVETSGGAITLCALGLVFGLPRLTHRGILWVEEAYPGAAAVQALHGLLPYRDYFFDKPPAAILAYLVWGAVPGVGQRLAGAGFVMLCSWLAFRFGDEAWGKREGWLAAFLMAFHLTFYLPSAVMALAPDLIMVAPHLAAVWMAWRRTWLAAGALAAGAMAVHTKGLLVAAVCLFWAPLSALPALAGMLLFLIPGYGEQVWSWGLLYASDSFVTDPVREGLVRTAGWLGFHATLAIGAVVCLARGQKGQRARMAIWLVICLAGVAAGSRFFPRYYFLLLPCLTMLGARGLSLMPKRWMQVGALALLLVPLLRFGPGYLVLGWQGEGDWADTAMNRDSRESSRRILATAAPDDTILVWGYRPDILVYTRLKLGAPFLDSQPLTGVLGDRHLTSAAPTAPELAANNRRQLSELRPTWVIDGLGPYNPALAVSNYPDLAAWLNRYEIAFRTSGCIAYRLKE